MSSEKQLSEEQGEVWRKLQEVPGKTYLLSETSYVTNSGEYVCIKIYVKNGIQMIYATLEGFKMEEGRDYVAVRQGARWTVTIPGAHFTAIIDTFYDEMGI